MSNDITLNYRSSKLVCFLCFIILFLYSLPYDIFAGTYSIEKGNIFPNISLEGPFFQNDKRYLGLSEKKTYSINNIHADFILIELFSIYCPVCQTHADKFNRLYKLIEKDDLIGRKMKMLGIGMGNNNNEVEYFKKYHGIQYPCIADQDFRIHKSLNEPRTPLLIVIDKRTAPYKVVSVLDFSREPESLIKYIRDEILNIQSSTFK
jgi:peroxiredoxin